MVLGDALPTYYVSHGGGPWPWMMDEMPGRWDMLAASLRDIPRQVGRSPRAIVCVTAHWEASDFTVQANPMPPMIYDYGGFPEHTYHVRYPAPGSPELASLIGEMGAAAGISVRADADRGFDHGTFVPLFVAYPDADVPVVQLSLKHGLDPEEHLAMGRAIAPLRDDDVLIIGSGSSFHNMHAFGAVSEEPSRVFDEWLNETVVETIGIDRAERLRSWERAPGARACHPREEHLLPLMVVAGAAEQDKGTNVFHQSAMGVTASSFRFG